MSLFSSNFAFKRTKPRKLVSKSPLKLTAEEIARDLGQRCTSIDVKIADQKIDYDMKNGDWNTDEAETIGGTASTADARRIQNSISTLTEENNMLKLKVEILLNLVAESVAELPTGRV